MQQHQVCRNCWYTYKQSWALSHWIAKHSAVNFITFGGINVKLRHKAGLRSIDKPLPNQYLSHYNHNLSVWLSDYKRYTVLVRIQAWINVEEHDTLCPNIALELDWPMYKGALAMPKIQEVTDTLIGVILEHWKNSCHGIITVDEWQAEGHIGRRYHLAKGADLLRTDIPVAAQHSRLLTIPASPQEEPLPVPNAETVTDDSMTLVDE